MLPSIYADLKTFLILILLSLILIFADNFNFLSLPKSLLQYVTSPIQYGLYKSSLSVVRQFDFIFLSRRASQQNKALSEQLAQILSENANLRKQIAEKESFSEQQKALNTQTFNLVPARPLGYSRFLLIDKGSDDGLKVNQTVIYKDNYIGQIKEVSSKRATVELPSDPDSHIAAFSQNDKGRAKGVLSGQFGSEMLMDKILHEEQIERNDLIYSEGTELDIPRGLILGQVSEVIPNENEVFKQAKVKPVFDVGNLELVFVIIN